MADVGTQLQIATAAAGAIGIVIGGVVSYITKGGAAWRAAAEGNERLIRTRETELKDSRAEVTELRADNKELAAKVSALETEVASLKAGPNYAGIQSHLDAMEARNIERHKGVVDQLAAQTSLLTKLSDSSARAAGSVRTRRTDGKAVQA